MIDTHCHLTFPDFAARVPEVLRTAREAGVHGCITISTTTRDCLEALAIAERFDNVWCTSGVHPLHSHESPHDWSSIERVARSARCVAWGELGLDNHYDHPPRDVQDRVLAEQLAVIVGLREREPAAFDLPVVLHCREAFADLIPILRAAPLDPTRMVFHCFTGTPDDARLVLDFGAMISFTGVVTYRNARDVAAAAKLVPDDRIMVETDAPFLSPEPKRGVRPCEPAMSMLTARFLADLRGVPWESPDDPGAGFHATINRNTERFFGIPAARLATSGDRA
ncbi:MAG: TatD family hydrolase [Phycisphaerales bacterium]|nr:TatD family hydrolase [Phycisphaerales bacterium]